MSEYNPVHAVARSAAVVKLICGVANNAAWLVALDAYDHARRSRRYRHHVKHLFREAVREWHDYEHKLIYATENRMFCMADMSADVRNKYGDITDHEYYDFWAAVGDAAYEESKPLINSLWNKYRLSLNHNHIAEADIVAWVMTGMAALELAVAMFDKAINECQTGYGLKKPLLMRIFGQFSIARVSAAWRRALIALSPEAEDAGPDDIDRRNIEHGLTQLCDAWSNPTTLYNSTMDAVHDYDEIFRTAGEQKKAIREITEVRDETIEELNNEP